MKYDPTTIMLHWITVCLIVISWLLAQVIDVFAANTWQVAIRSTHIALGVSLILVLGLRLIWRATGGMSLPALDAGWQGKAAKAMHHVLYLAIAVVLVSGLVNVWARGASIYGLFEITSFAPGDRATHRLVGGVHELATNGLLILAGLHAAMALAHHYILRDSVLRRMLPGT